FDNLGALAGFSTIQLIEGERQGRRWIVLFSGDTVIDQECWGQKALQQGFVSFIISLKVKQPRRHVYWFLITKGYKTYLLIRKNFCCFPNYRQATPIEFKTLLDEVAKLKYPKHYDPERGLIVFDSKQEAQGKVKEEFEDLDELSKRNPDIAFFLERN